MTSRIAAAIWIALALAAIAGGDLVLGATSLQPASPTAAEEAERIRRVQREAVARPFDLQARQAFLSLLPRDGDYYVVEGDIRLNEDEVLEYLASQSAAQARANASPELLVAMHNGERDYYRDAASRTLMYAIDRPSFPGPKEYGTVVEKFELAATEWEQACPECGVRFRHVEEADAAPSEADLSFTVRYRPTGPFIALAFFPHDPPFERQVTIYPRYYSTSYDQVGVLRHELGHVLGYRHEQIRITDARQEAGRLAQCWQPEPGLWQELSVYDKRSVMHYYCGELDAGSKTFALTELDRAGHSLLYGPVSRPSDPPEAAPAALAEPSGGERARVAQLWKEAVEKPFDKTRQKALGDALPRQGEYFIVEGDIRLTEDELVAYLSARSDAPAPAATTPELSVNVHLGARDYYANPVRRTLNYAIDRRSFSRETDYETVVTSMREATLDWQCSGCRIRFSHHQDLDRAPAIDRVNFVVRAFDAGGAYIAAAFFPHDAPVRRFLDVDPSFFSTSFNKVGVLRHELGHVLGYRHEHIRDVPGCYKERGFWQPLTPYGPKSVMHYFCGGAGSLELELTKTDRAGHRALYGTGPTARTETGPELTDAALVIRLEGGDVGENAVRVFRILSKHRLLPVATHRVQPGETLESIYKKYLGLPGHPEALTEFAVALNGKASLGEGELSVGEALLYPDLTFSKYDFIRTRDSTESNEDAAQFQKRWGYILKDPEQAKSDDRVVLIGYELRLGSVSLSSIQRVHKELDALSSRNILVYEPPSPAQTIKYYSSIPPSKWMPKEGEVLALEQEADVRLLLEQPQDGEVKDQCQTNCPQVVLIDSPVYIHPDLQGAIREGGLPDKIRAELVDDKAEHNVPADPTITGLHQHVKSGDVNDFTHGTHLAGIIGSRDNDFGLIGMHPDAEIYSWDWPALRSDLPNVATKIGNRQSKIRASGRQQIYVFATSWPHEALHVQGRRFQNPLARQIRQEGILVVAAAGHSASGDDLSDASLQGPANIGDQENVVVVTACESCQEGGRLMPGAHYSTTGFVHLAAPGQRIPSTVRDGKYAVGDGTSPATAMTAGFISAMVSRYPNSFLTAYAVKSRLLVTAAPFLMEPGHSDPAADPALFAHKGVAAGILDPGLALLDPQVTWLKSIKLPTAPEAPPRRMEPAGTIEWKKESISYKPEGGGGVAAVAVGEIYRILQKNGAVVFFVERRKDTRGWRIPQPYIERIGPVRVSQSTLTSPLLELKDHNNAAVALGDIEDLLLSYLVPFEKQ